MTDTATFSSIPAVPRPKEDTLPLPAPVLFGGPVTIGDCATPFAGSTVLHLLLRDSEDDQ